MIRSRVQTASSRSPRIGYVIGRLDRALRREIGALVAPFGLTVPKYTALSILRDRPGLSNAQLARRTYVTPQSMNEVLIALEADGLIVRSPAANHGRVVEVVAQRTRARGAGGVRPRRRATWRTRCSPTSTRPAASSCSRRSSNCVYRLGAGLRPPLTGTEYRSARGVACPEYIR